MWSMHDVGWGWWLIMSVGMVAFWALVVWGILMLVRSVQAPRAAEPPARDVLDRRLASGDISLEDYERLREALGPR